MLGGAAAWENVDSTAGERENLFFSRAVGKDEAAVCATLRQSL